MSGQATLPRHSKFLSSIERHVWSLNPYRGHEKQACCGGSGSENIVKSMVWIAGSNEDVKSDEGIDNTSSFS